MQLPIFIYPGGMKGLVDLGGTRTYDLADILYVKGKRALFLVTPAFLTHPEAFGLSIAPMFLALLPTFFLYVCTFFGIDSGVNANLTLVFFSFQPVIDPLFTLLLIKVYRDKLKLMTIVHVNKVSVITSQ
ncbi:unnamed protein product [Caenorhabditis auriculariae]|uniref:Uncharacterized protein n=1 Tax=Caenorhabditis auriculariae TaxID=2777116 RepID=A0A8S1HAY4_9PELO|nr:unnamed protein product [Caenorhabditis auriculariae]